MDFISDEQSLITFVSISISPEGNIQAPTLSHSLFVEIPDVWNVLFKKTHSTKVRLFAVLYQIPSISMQWESVSQKPQK